jgi:acetyl-CoA/propionyl-CoA carboxylase biotin carboxyl carrier protein
MFERVLVANRGEIAVRIMGTLRRMGISSVAVYSDADARALHVAMADSAVRIGPAPARQSYLAIDRVVEAALASGAQAVHPGYGFLSENPAFARSCADAGLVFVGPDAAVIKAMGDKIAAKASAIAAGVPVVPGRHEPDMDDAAVAAAVREVGRPALLKPAAGGGGKGMRVIRDGDDVEAAIAGARRESRASFGDDRLLVERYVDRPRHVEVQILADHHGRVLHLGERDCTLQRRHQKVIEEAPSTLLDDATRHELCDAAVRLARDVGYTNAGTVEFVVPWASPQDFAFLEMNTRLQVEHPVTEAVTGIDLVEQQLRIASGQRLAMEQQDIVIRGHAAEARVYAEDPWRGYLPTGGEIILWSAPADVRVDSGVATGAVVTADYDPMIAKVIAHASTRDEALDALQEALRATVCLGVTTNIDDLADLLDDERVRQGDMDTSLLDERVPQERGVEVADIAAAAPLLLAAPEDDLWEAGDAWRLGGPAPQHWDVAGHPVALRVHDGALDVAIDGASVEPARVDATAFDGMRLWLHARGRHRALDARRPRDRRRHRSEDVQLAGPWSARSPMPGAVIAVDVAVGDEVAAGAPLAVVEAMKMEHTLRSPGRGVVTRIAVSPGARVSLDAVLVEVDLKGEVTS